MRRLGPHPSPAFTLIELLVVIAIIAAQAALLLVAIVPMINKGPELQTTSDLRNLTIALNNFKQKHGVFPPSHITLSYKAELMDPVSLGYITTIWERIDFSGAAGPIDWAGNGQKGTYTLTGDQCLVFFLGGIPDSIAPDRRGCRGFSSNPKNPTDLGPGTRESFYQFDNSRLIFHNSLSPFYSFADPWSTGQPYAYFSSGKRKDGYNPGPGSDCPSLVYNTFPPWPLPNNGTKYPGGPYFEFGTNPPRYYNATTFQIISAGKNGVFGPGGAWPVPPPPAPQPATGFDQAGQDNQTNFYDFTLGVPK